MNAPAALPTLGWVDWTLLAVLALSVAVGLWRGLVFELMSLVGWFAAYLAAQWGSPSVPRTCRSVRPGRRSTMRRRSR